MGLDERDRERGFPALDASDLGTLTLAVEIAEEHSTLATVAQDAQTGLYRNFIGMPASTKLGRSDSSQVRAVWKAEDSLASKLRRLL
jgi:hypothetical protein